MVVLLLEVWRTANVPETTYLFIDKWPRAKIRLKHFMRNITFDGTTRIRIKWVT